MVVTLDERLSQPPESLTKSWNKKRAPSNTSLIREKPVTSSIASSLLYSPVLCTPIQISDRAHILEKQGNASTTIFIVCTTPTNYVILQYFDSEHHALAFRNNQQSTYMTNVHDSTRLRCLVGFVRCVDYRGSSIRVAKYLQCETTLLLCKHQNHIPTEA